MPIIADVLLKYDTLCSFCDSFWNRAVLKYPQHFQCQSGCSTCCELQSITAIEAFRIFLVIKSDLSSFSSKNDLNYCVFLHNNKCKIYNFRPVICRTHGLLLKNSEHPCLQTCQLNFTNCQDPENSAILDWENLTMNLARINMAFCMLSGFPEMASERILLSDIASGNIPDKFNSIIASL